MTVAQLMDQFVDIYGVTKWGPVTFDHNTALNRNYINPVLGDIQVQQVKKHLIDKFYQQLSVTKPVEVGGKKSKGFLSPSTIEKISHVLNAAFKQAVAWEIIEKSPCEGAIRPVSDLRNKFTEIESTVKSGAPVYLTKNGYGSMVVMSIEAYSKLTESVEESLDIADMMAERTEKRYTHEEVFSKLREAVND